MRRDPVRVQAALIHELSRQIDVRQRGLMRGLLQIRRSGVAAFRSWSGVR